MEAGLLPPTESFIPHVAASACLVGILLLTAPAHAARRLPESNVDRLKTAADSAAVLCAERFHLRTDERIQWIEGQDADALSQFLLTRIAGRLAWNGIGLFSSRESNAGSASLVLTVGKASISYDAATASGFTGGSSVRRITEIEVAARLSRADSACIDTFRVRLDDFVKRSELETVERGSQLLGKPERPRSGLGFRMIGPVLVVGSIGWMVYSFYSIRSH
jgi:hypothetical protein